MQAEADVEMENGAEEGTDNVHPQVKKLQKELNTGSVALVLLTLIERAEGPVYGYQIAKQLEQADAAAAGKQAALYPVLRNMSSSGLLDSYVEPSVSGPPRRYYRITDEGRLVLREWKQVWARNRAMVEAVLEGTNHDK